MKKRAGILISLLVAVALGIALALPRTHFALLGWAQGESYFQGQPTSYWAGALKKHPFIGDQGDVGKRLREGGPAAIPVLCELLKDEEQGVRQQSMLALSLIDWQQEGWKPAVAM